jgi:hypothetical protein
VNDRLSCDLEKIDTGKFNSDLNTFLQSLPSLPLLNPQDIDNFVENLTISLQNSIDIQKKIVKNNSQKIKPWWNSKILAPLAEKRNRARKWMLLSKSTKSCDCFNHWQSIFKEKVFELKKNHWRKFLAECNDFQLFKAYKFTKPNSNGSVAPLLNDQKILTSNKEEQASLLFKGTSDAPINCSLSDIPSIPSTIINSPFSFPTISHFEIDNIISNLPKKKSRGHDDIANELIIWGKESLIPFFIRLFSSCLKIGYFPLFWRHTTTAIIRKADKDSYSLPGSYRPIALLSCLGKIFESILTKRITFWAENNHVLAEGHFGGRAGRCTDDANLFLTSWIRQKWREKKIVSALFLDVKSAFTTVVKERLLHNLKIKNAPPYILSIISSFLSDRTTSLKMDDYLSSPFLLKCGLPQGSPLSPILYIIYNSSLLINNPLSLSQNAISLGFIDDVTHLVAKKYLETSIRKLEIEGNRSLEWGVKHNAIFDKKKANFMVFTHNPINIRPFKFGDLSLPTSYSVKYLGIIFDPKLLFSNHIKKVKKCADQTSSQLIRISRCSFGVGFHQSKNLVISVLRSRVLYGSSIWATNRKHSIIKNLFDKIDNQANRIILGLFKITPCKFLSRESPLIPFFEILKRKNHLYIIKNQQLHLLTLSNA